MKQKSEWLLAVVMVSVFAVGSVVLWAASESSATAAMSRSGAWAAAGQSRAISKPPMFVQSGGGGRPRGRGLRAGGRRPRGRGREQSEYVAWVTVR